MKQSLDPIESAKQYFLKLFSEGKLEYVVNLYKSKSIQELIQKNAKSLLKS